MPEENAINRNGVSISESLQEQVNSEMARLQNEAWQHAMMNNTLPSSFQQHYGYSPYAGWQSSTSAASANIRNIKNKLFDRYPAVCIQYSRSAVLNVIIDRVADRNQNDPSVSMDDLVTEIILELVETVDTRPQRPIHFRIPVTTEVEPPATKQPKITDKPERNIQND